MSVNNFIPDDGSLWSIRAVDISGNYGQKLLFDASGNTIVRTGNTDRLTIGNTGAWNVEGGMTYNNATNTLTVGTFSGALSGNATSATNIAGGTGGSLPYQSAASTTAFLSNGTTGQYLVSNGGASAPSWTTPTVTKGNFQFDDMWGSGSSNNGQFGMTVVGTHGAASPQQAAAPDGYNGITRIFNSAANTAAGYQSGSSTIFRNLLSNGLGFTMIFRPWSTGTTTNTTLYCGFSSDFSAGAPANQLAWQYSTNQAPTNVWNFRQDSASVYTATGLPQGSAEWFKMTLVRTGNLTYTTTLQNITTPSAIFSYSGTVAASNLQLYMGGFVSCVSGATNKYLDIDYISCEFNSAH
jgi:hypothetical protein